MKTTILSICLMTVICFSSITGQVNDNTVAAPLELSSTIALNNVTGRIGHLAYNSKMQHVYVAALGNNTMEVVDLQNRKKINSIKSLEQPQGIEFIPNSETVTVSLIGNKLCKIFNANTFKLLGSIELELNGNTIRYSSLKQLIYIGNGNGDISVCDANTFKVKTIIKLPAQAESFQIDENSNRMFVNVPKTSQIVVIDLIKNAIMNTWTIDGATQNYPMAIDNANHRLFIGCRNPAKLLVIDSETGKKIAALDIDGDANDVFYNPTTKQLYVSCGDGYLNVIKQEIKEVKQVIKQQAPVAKNSKSKKGAKQTKQATPKQETKLVKQDSYESISRIFTSKGSRTSLYIPELNQLIVAAPEASGKEAQLMIFQIK